MKVQEALIDDEYTKYCDAKIANGATVNQIMSRQDWHYCWNKSQSALSEIGKCEPVAWAITNEEDKFNRLGAIYHTKSDAQNHIDGYKDSVLGADFLHIVELCTSPISKEWVGLSDIQKAECASHTSKLGILGAVNATESMCKQLNAEKG